MRNIEKGERGGLGGGWGMSGMTSDEDGGGWEGAGRRGSWV